MCTPTLAFSLKHHCTYSLHRCIAERFSWCIHADQPIIVLSLNCHWVYLPWDIQVPQSMCISLENSICRSAFTLPLLQWNSSNTPPKGCVWMGKDPGCKVLTADNLLIVNSFWTVLCQILYLYHICYVRAGSWGSFQVDSFAEVYRTFTYGGRETSAHCILR